MRILITGASGFIGAFLTRYATAQGLEVVALCRSGKVPGWQGACWRWSLGEAIPAPALAGVQCAIHLAHDFGGEPGARLTIDSTLASVAQLRAAGVSRQLYFSSYSAGEHAGLLYGRTKLAIERGLAGHTDTAIVRPGLVIGPGGIYGRIAALARRLPIIPLPNADGEVPVIALERLAHETLAILRAPTLPAEANLFERELVSLRQLARDAAAAAGRRPLLLSIPAGPIRAGLRAAAALGIALPVNADNLDGFLANQTARHVSTLQERSQ